MSLDFAEKQEFFSISKEDANRLFYPYLNSDFKGSSALSEFATKEEVIENLRNFIAEKENENLN